MYGRGMPRTWQLAHALRVSQHAGAPLRRACLLAPILPLALVGIEQLLAQPDRLWRYLDELIVLDIGQCPLQRHLDGRNEPYRLILGVRPDIGELLSLEH